MVEERGTFCSANDASENVESDPDEPSAEFQHPNESETPSPSQNEIPESLRPPPKKRKENSALLQYLKERQKDRVHFQNCLEQLSKSPAEDDVDMFFKTMAMTVKKFPPNLVTETKMKVFQVVTEAELLNQQGQSTSSSPSTSMYGSPRTSVYGSSSTSMHGSHSAHDNQQRPYICGSSSAGGDGPLPSPGCAPRETLTGTSNIVSEALSLAFSDLLD